MKSRQTIRPLTLISCKPRNPLVAPALMRLAGRHGSNAKPRQAAHRDLQRQIAQLDSA